MILQDSTYKVLSCIYFIRFSFTRAILHGKIVSFQTKDVSTC